MNLIQQFCLALKARSRPYWNQTTCFHLQYMPSPTSLPRIASEEWGLSSSIEPRRPSVPKCRRSSHTALHSKPSPWIQACRRSSFKASLVLKRWGRRMMWWWWSSQSFGEWWRPRQPLRFRLCQWACSKLYSSASISNPACRSHWPNTRSILLGFRYDSSCSRQYYPYLLL